MSNDSRNNPVHPMLEAHGFNSGALGMTLRQYAAIKLNVPNSGDPWLDEMIERSRRDKFARAAMQGMYSVVGIDFGTKKNISDIAYAQADAMIEASK